MILGTAVQQSECNLLLNWIFEKNPANIYRITQMCPKSNVVFYRSGHHRQTELLLIMIFFSYMEKKSRPQHAKNTLSVEILVKSSLCFPRLFLRIYMLHT